MKLWKALRMLTEKRLTAEFVKKVKLKIRRNYEKRELNWKLEEMKENKKDGFFDVTIINLNSIVTRFQTRNAVAN